MKAEGWVLGWVVDGWMDGVGERMVDDGVVMDGRMDRWTDG